MFALTVLVAACVAATWGAPVPSASARCGTLPSDGALSSALSSGRAVHFISVSMAAAAEGGGSSGAPAHPLAISEVSDVSVCALEAALRNRRPVVLHVFAGSSSSVSGSSSSAAPPSLAPVCALPALAALLDAWPRLWIVHLSPAALFAPHPGLAAWFARGEWAAAAPATAGAHLSDGARLALLHTHGGVYLDADELLLRAGSLAAIGERAMGLESAAVVASAVLAFPRAHPFLAAAIDDFGRSFDGAYWGFNGPLLVTRTWAALAAGGGGGALGAARAATNVTLFPPSAFYGLPYGAASKLFDPAAELARDFPLAAAALCGRGGGGGGSGLLSSRAHAVHLWAHVTAPRLAAALRGDCAAGGARTGARGSSLRGTLLGSLMAGACPSTFAHVLDAAASACGDDASSNDSPFVGEGSTQLPFPFCATPLVADQTSLSNFPSQQSAPGAAASAHNDGTGNATSAGDGSTILLFPPLDPQTHGLVLSFWLRVPAAEAVHRQQQRQQQQHESKLRATLLSSPSDVDAAIGREDDYDGDSLSADVACAGGLRCVLSIGHRHGKQQPRSELLFASSALVPGRWHHVAVAVARHAHVAAAAHHPSDSSPPAPTITATTIAISLTIDGIRQLQPLSEAAARGLPASEIVEGHALSAVAPPSLHALSELNVGLGRLEWGGDATDAAGVLFVNVSARLSASAASLDDLASLHNAARASFRPPPLLMSAPPPPSSSAAPSDYDAAMLSSPLVSVLHPDWLGVRNAHYRVPHFRGAARSIQLRSLLFRPPPEQFTRGGGLGGVAPPHPPVSFASPAAPPTTAEGLLDLLSSLPHLRLVVVDGVLDGTADFAVRLRAARPDLELAVVVHSSPSSPYHAMEAERIADVVRAARRQADGSPPPVRRIGFVKSGMAGLFAALGVCAWDLTNFPPTAEEAAAAASPSAGEALERAAVSIFTPGGVGGGSSFFLSSPPPSRLLFPAAGGLSVAAAVSDTIGSTLSVNNATAPSAAAGDPHFSPSSLFAASSASPPPLLHVFVPGVGAAKNLATQLLAVCVLPGVVVHLIAQPEVAYLRFCPAPLVLHGQLPPDVFGALLARMDLVLYVSLSECSPGVVLESIAAGVPCLMGHTSPIYEADPEVAALLTVAAPDDAAAISAAAQRILSIVRGDSGDASAGTRANIRDTSAGMGGSNAGANGNPIRPHADFSSAPSIMDALTLRARLRALAVSAAKDAATSWNAFFEADNAPSHCGNDLGGSRLPETSLFSAQLVASLPLQQQHLSPAPSSHVIGPPGVSPAASLRSAKPSRLWHLSAPSHITNAAMNRPAGRRQPALDRLIASDAAERGMFLAPARARELQVTPTPANSISISPSSTPSRTPALSPSAFPASIPVALLNGSVCATWACDPTHSGVASNWLQSPSASASLLFMVAPTGVAGNGVGNPVTDTSGVVYVGTDVAFRLYALDGRTGAMRWSYQMGARTGGAPLLLNDGSLVITSEDGSTYKLNRANGALLWKNTGTSASNSVTAGLYNGTLILPTFANKAMGLNARTGATLWTLTTGRWCLNSPAVDALSGVAYFGCSDNIFRAVNAMNGTLRWSYSASQPWSSAPTLPGNGYVYAPNENGFIYCLAATTGAVAWSYKVPASSYAIYATGIFHGGNYIVVSNAGVLYSLNGLTGALVASFTTGTGALSGPTGFVNASGALYVGTTAGVAVLQATTLALLFRLPLAMGTIVAGLGANGELYTKSSTNLLMGVGSPDAGATPSPLPPSNSVPPSASLSTSYSYSASPSPCTSSFPDWATFYGTVCAGGPDMVFYAYSLDYCRSLCRQYFSSFCFGVQFYPSSSQCFIWQSSGGWIAQPDDWIARPDPRADSAYPTVCSVNFAILDPSVIKNLPRKTPDCFGGSFTASGSSMYSFTPSSSPHSSLSFSSTPSASFSASCNPGWATFASYGTLGFLELYKGSNSLGACQMYCLSSWNCVGVMYEHDTRNCYRVSDSQVQSIFAISPFDANVILSIFLPSLDVYNTLPRLPWTNPDCGGSYTPSASATPAPCYSPGWVTFYGSDCAGGDLTLLSNVYSLLNCQWSCNSDPLCAGVQYFQNAYQCLLKRKSGWIVRPSRSYSSACSMNMAALDAVRLAMLPSTVADCGSGGMSFTMSSSGSFSFSGSSSASVPASPNLNSVSPSATPSSSGSISPGPCTPGWASYPGYVTLGGRELQLLINVANPHSCKAACVNFGTSCAGFDFEMDTGYCFLLDASSWWSVNNYYDPNVVASFFLPSLDAYHLSIVPWANVDCGGSSYSYTPSASASPAPCYNPTWATFYGTACAGGDLTLLLNVYSLLNCQSSCNSNPLCAGVQYFSESYQCLLKRASGWIVRPDRFARNSACSMNMASLDAAHLALLPSTVADCGGGGTSFSMSASSSFSFSGSAATSASASFASSYAPSVTPSASSPEPCAPGWASYSGYGIAWGGVQLRLLTNVGSLRNCQSACLMYGNLPFYENVCSGVIFEADTGYCMLLNFAYLGLTNWYNPNVVVSVYLPLCLADQLSYLPWTTQDCGGPSYSFTPSPSASPFSAVCAPGWSTLAGWSSRDAHFAVSGGVLSLQGCRSLCLADTRCISVIFAASASLCYLQQELFSAPVLAPNSAVTWAVFFPALSPDQFARVSFLSPDCGGGSFSYTPSYSPSATRSHTSSPSVPFFTRTATATTGAAGNESISPSTRPSQSSSPSPAPPASMNASASASALPSTSFSPSRTELPSTSSLPSGSAIAPTMSASLSALLTGSATSTGALAASPTRSTSNVPSATMSAALAASFTESIASTMFASPSALSTVSAAPAASFSESISSTMSASLSALSTGSATSTGTLAASPTTVSTGSATSTGTLAASPTHSTSNFPSSSVSASPAASLSPSRSFGASIVETPTESPTSSPTASKSASSSYSITTTTTSTQSIMTTQSITTSTTLGSTCSVSVLPSLSAPSSLPPGSVSSNGTLAVTPSISTSYFPTPSIFATSTSSVSSSRSFGASTETTPSVWPSSTQTGSGTSATTFSSTAFPSSTAPTTVSAVSSATPMASFPSSRSFGTSTEATLSLWPSSSGATSRSQSAPFTPAAAPAASGAAAVFTPSSGRIGTASVSPVLPGLAPVTMASVLPGASTVTVLVFITYAGVPPMQGSNAQAATFQLLISGLATALTATTQPPLYVPPESVSVMLFSQIVSSSGIVSYSWAAASARQRRALLLQQRGAADGGRSTVSSAVPAVAAVGLPSSVAARDAAAPRGRRRAQVLSTGAITSSCTFRITVASAAEAQDILDAVASLAFSRAMGSAAAAAGLNATVTTASASASATAATAKAVESSSFGLIVVGSVAAILVVALIALGVWLRCRGFFEQTRKSALTPAVSSAKADGDGEGSALHQNALLRTALAIKGQSVQSNPINTASLPLTAVAMTALPQKRRSSTRTLVLQGDSGIRIGDSDGADEPEMTNPMHDRSAAALSDAVRAKTSFAATRSGASQRLL